MKRYPSKDCADCGRGTFGRWGDSQPARCFACQALRDRQAAHRLHLVKLEQQARARRDEAIFAAVQAGQSQGSQARLYGLSRERIREIVRVVGRAMA